MSANLLIFLEQKRILKETLSEIFSKDILLITSDELEKSFSELNKLEKEMDKLSNDEKLNADELFRMIEEGDEILSTYSKLRDITKEVLDVKEKEQINHSVNYLQEQLSLIIKMMNLVKKDIKKINGDIPMIKSVMENAKTTEYEVNKIKDSLFSFFGLIVGLLAFIFVNYQFISSAKDLGMGKMLMFMGIANIGLICGILIILGILGDLLGQPKKLKNSYRILKSGWLFIGIVAIIVLGFSIDLFDRSEKNLTIDKQIKEVKEMQMREHEIIHNENVMLKNEIEALRNEITILKNKK